MAASTSRHGARRVAVWQNFDPTAAAGRHPPQPAGREESCDQRGVVTARSRKPLLAIAESSALSKDQILNSIERIYLGASRYGIAPASLVYFDKSVNEITVAEASYLRRCRRPRRRCIRCATADNPRGFRTGISGRPFAGERLDQAGRTPTRAQGYAGRPNVQWRACVRGEIFRRGSPPRLLGVRREEAYEGGLSVRTTLARRSR